MAYNPSYVAPPVGTTSQYTIPIHPIIQQPPLVSGTTPNVPVPTTLYTISPLNRQPTASPEASSTDQQQSEKPSSQQDS